MINCVIFSRVSTLMQDTDRQTEELKEYAVKMNYNLITVIEEQISGAKKNDERPELIKLMQLIDEGKVNKVLVWELSRLGRNVVEILQVIQVFNEKKVSLYIKNFSLETLNEDLKPNPLSMFMIQILLSVAEMERVAIRQRMYSGYIKHRKDGKSVGRIKGVSETKEHMLEKHKEVVKLLKKGMSVRNISRLTNNTSLATIVKVNKLLKNDTTKQKHPND
jgi:DNA invertase Pin-like site-specific DNA recombinase